MKVVDLKMLKAQGNKVTFAMPNGIEDNIPPGFYMLYYVDSRGKPSFSQMIRFDDKAVTP